MLLVSLAALAPTPTVRGSPPSARYVVSMNDDDINTNN